MVTEFALLVNAAVALGLAYEDSSHSSTTIGHGRRRASRWACSCAPRSATASSRWRCGDRRRSRPPLATPSSSSSSPPSSTNRRSASPKVTPTPTPTPTRAASSMASMRYGGGSTTTASARSSSSAAAARASRCAAAAPTSSACRDVLAVVGDAAPPLHRPPPARRVGDAARRTVDRVRECGHLRRCRRRCAPAAAPRRPRGRGGQDDARAPPRGRHRRPAAARLRGASAGGAEPVSPYVPFGVDTPEHEAARRTRS